MRATREPGAVLAAKRIKLSRWDVHMGPLGHLAADPRRLDGLSWQNFDERRLGAGSDYWPSIRVMERASIVGRRPV